MARKTVNGSTPIFLKREILDGTGAAGSEFMCMDGKDRGRVAWLGRYGLYWEDSGEEVGYDYLSDVRFAYCGHIDAPLGSKKWYGLPDNAPAEEVEEYNR